MSNVKNPFEGYTPVKSSADVLTAGEHVVRLLWAKSTNSFNDHKDQDAGKDHEWADPTPQILCQFGNENGVFMHRFQQKGFMKFDECSDETIEKKKLVNKGGYACIEDKDGDFLRIVSDDKTQDCTNIINDFLYKLKAEGGDIDKAIAEKNKIVVRLIKDDSAEGNGRTIVKYFREYTAEDAEEELESAVETESLN
jgi:hypothetical protein